MSCGLAGRRSRGHPPPPERAATGRNHDWTHLYNADVISMPDKWEYPWYAAWDLAFHCVALALVDPDFAKEQLMLIARVVSAPQRPAAGLRVGIRRRQSSRACLGGLARLQDREKRRGGSARPRFSGEGLSQAAAQFHLVGESQGCRGQERFQGGFLGLDNIGVFDRSAPLPTGGHIEQSDGTSWMGMYCLNMLAIAMELAREDPAYEDVASKFWEHFLYIAHAMNNIGGDGIRHVG